MCDYLCVGRHRRVLTIASSSARPAPTAGLRCEFQWATLTRALRRAVLACAPRSAESTDVRERSIDVLRLRILLCESVADDKSTGSAIATRLWRCALGTASWLAQQAQFFDGKLVLEVGAGTGLCSLVLAATSTARVVSSDIDEVALSLVRTAAERQSLILEEVIHFDLQDEGSLLPEAAWMVACDVMYTPELAAALARRCAEQLKRGGHVLVTDPDRKPRAVFQATLDELLGMHTPFVRMQDAAPLQAAALGPGRVVTPTIILLLVDEHCRPPFF
ncbi:hypothetical protein AB1Y20_019169 [Prymnesium parvum]|uniref:Calmodulin-lysine N-methyltransferase n=1 Tax=Prymnesium parvum TaxID=97485 RepID=A0AB34JUD2_PRYPA